MVLSTITGLFVFRFMFSNVCVGNASSFELRRLVHTGRTNKYLILKPETVVGTRQNLFATNGSNSTFSKTDISLQLQVAGGFLNSDPKVLPKRAQQGKEIEHLCLHDN